MKRLMLALAATALLSCQNETSTTAPAPTSSLALRVVSAKALAQVEWASVKLSWGDQTRETTVAWSDKKLRLDGLPLGDSIRVHMEGWNDARGRRVVLWSGDTALKLGSSGTNWDMEDGAPILIKDAVAPSAPDLASRLSANHVVEGGKLSLTLATGKTDTVRIAAMEGDTVFADGNEVKRVDGAFEIVVGAGCDSVVLVVGKNGLTSTFEIVAGRFLASASTLVDVASGVESWNKDTLSVSLDEGKSDTVRIDTTGVAGVSRGGNTVSRVGGWYVIVVDAPGTSTVVVTGDGARSDTFKLVVRSAAQVVTRPGLKAHLRMVPEWVGATCSLRVVIEAGEISGVSLFAPSGVAFTKASDTLWKLDWSTPSTGVGDSLEIHVVGTGTNGTDSVLIGVKVNYDRKGPSIAPSDTMLVVGRNGGLVSWKATDDRGVRSTEVQDNAGLTVTCPGEDACFVTGVKRSFTIRAVDLLGNESTRKVEVRVDSVAPKVLSVKNAANDNPIAPGGTLSTNETVGLLVSASDSGSAFQVIVRRASSNDSIVKDWSAGAIIVPGLGEGTWALTVRDAVGNATEWGSLVVRRIVQTGDRVPGFGARLGALPQWVAKGCSVVVVRDSGRISSIASKLTFKTDSDSARWVAWWEASADAKIDSLTIDVKGRGDIDGVIHLRAEMSIDREGPSIEIKSVLRDGAFRVGRDGGTLAFTVSDDRSVDSAWIPGGVLSCDKSGVCLSSMLKESVAIHALDSLGNERVVDVAVKRDSLAPVVESVLAGDGTTVVAGGILRRTTDSGFATLRIVATDKDGNGAKVQLIRTTGEAQTDIAMVNGTATVTDLPIGEWSVYVSDSLGNGSLDEGGWDPWGKVTVRPLVRPPVASRENGVFGSETLLRGYGMVSGGTLRIPEFDSLPVDVYCPDSGAATLRYWTPGDGWQDLSGGFRLRRYWGSDSVGFRCVAGAESSQVVTRSWGMLQRPWIRAAGDTFRVGPATATIVRDTTNRLGNPKDAVIEYCIGSAQTCAEASASWTATKKTDSVQVSLSESGTLWARVAYAGKRGYATSRTFTIIGGVVDWTRNFLLASAPIALDNQEVYDKYHIVSWLGQGGDTLNVKRKPSTGIYDLQAVMNWQIVGRPQNAYGYFGLDMQLDSEVASQYDFTDADSITFDYSSSGSVLAVRLYLIPYANIDYDLERLQYADSGAGVPSSSTRHVCVKLKTDLRYPGWSSVADKQTWNDIKGAIGALRFVLEPVSDSKGVPSMATSTLKISNVTVHGNIVKK